MSALQYPANVLQNNYTNTLAGDTLWTSPVRHFKGVGEAFAQKLQKLDIFTLGDIMLHVPFRYQDRTRIMPLRNALPDQEVLIQGEVLRCQERKDRRKQLIVHLTDGTGSMQLVFFHYYPSMLKQLVPGVLVRCFGEVKWYRQIKTMTHPELQWVDQHTPVDAHLTPVYATLDGLSQRWWRNTVKALLSHPDSLHESYEYERKLDQLFGIDFMEALRAIHFPEPDCDKTLLLERRSKPYQRLIFEELLAHRMSMARVRLMNKHQQATPLSINRVEFSAAKSLLGFQLTLGQEQVLDEILTDLAACRPMMRLLQGDVGAGKTVIALLSSFVAVKNNVQVAVMAPTEVLAEQLYAEFKKFFTQIPASVGFLVGSLKPKEKKAVYHALQSAQIQVVVGTHALFQDDVVFASLGLVVIDEQHRFGVHQRLSLNAKGASVNKSGDIKMIPHQLIMTATPIPRTLCMSYYAHLDSSQILMLPKGRKPIQTIVVSNQKRDEIIARIQSHCSQQEQVYWVCPLVEESEHLDAQAAQHTYEDLKQKCPTLSIGLVHGKLTPAEKGHVMQAFYRGECQVLIATTVIEVGVNVPNATLMVIENAERFGLSQLHQLRGRVGRGTVQSYCVLMYQAPLSSYAKERLKVMRQTTDGFEIAEKDLALRGPGEVLGVRQSGAHMLLIANFTRDHAYIPKVNAWIKENPLAEDQEQRLIDRWFKSKTEYAKV